MRSIEAKGTKERKMAFVEIKRAGDQEPIDLNFTYISPTSQEITEAKIASTTGPRRRRTADLRDPPERAVLSHWNLNHVGQNMKSAEISEPLNRRRILQSQITKHTAISRLTHHPRLTVQFKLPHSESCLVPGTGVLYMERRSITSNSYVTACTVEALSLLADVSSKVKRTHIQQSCNLTPKLSKIDAYENERFKQTPLQQKMKSVLKNLNRLKEKLISVQHSKKMPNLLATENSYKVVRKLRSPRTSLPAFRCPTRLQKNISLSKCDEICSRMLRSNASMAHTADLRGCLAKTDASAITSANKNVLGEGKVSHGKSVSVTDSVALAGRNSMTLERVSKSSSNQISGMKKRARRGVEREKRYTNRILQFIIGETTVPEKRIRQTLGNNPDTSKALRLLLRERKVMRLGSGGRGRAYEYVATEKGLLYIHGVKQAVSEVVELTPESVVSSCNPVSGTTIVE